MPDATPEHTDEVWEALDLMKLMREEPAWALSRVQAAARLEAEVERLREDKERLRTMLGKIPQKVLAAIMLQVAAEEAEPDFTSWVDANA